MSELFNCSVDYLLKGTNFHEEKNAKEDVYIVMPFNFKDYEYKSKRTFLGVPLVHINFGKNKTAKGLIAIGFKSIGLISVGLLSVGLLSLGLLSIGLISLGILTLGLLSIGAIAIGLFSIGAISIGIVAVGAIAIGQFSFGALAIGQYFALGDHAYSNVALAKTKAKGTNMFYLSNYSKVEVTALLRSSVPNIYKWLVTIISKFY